MIRIRDLVRRCERIVFPAVVALLIAAPLTTVSAVDLSLIPSAGMRVDLDAPKELSQYLSFALDHSTDRLWLGFKLSAYNDLRALSSQASFYGDWYPDLELGGFEYEAERIGVRVGRLPNKDIVGGPYSLYVSSVHHTPFLAELAYDGDRFLYVTRAIVLNQDSDRGYPDRGANLRFMAFRFGGLTLGYQEASVYTGKVFDAEYFVNPTPNFMIQYGLNGAGAPWSRTGNDNAILGFFGTYERDQWYGYAQLLVDDFNMNAILNPDAYQNPSKVAWSIGGTYDTPIGTVGLYHAGATKHTFQSIGSGSVGSASDARYGYTYYPHTVYELRDEERVIDNQDNYVGYLWGENNMAFRAELDTTLAGVDIAAGLETVISGPKSPANPWHQFNSFLEEQTDGKDGTRFLREQPGDRLETALLLHGAATRSFGNVLVSADLTTGVRFNALEITDVPPELAGGDPDNSIPYFEPSDRTVPVLRLGVTVSYAWNPFERF